MDIQQWNMVQHSRIKKNKKKLLKSDIFGFKDIFIIDDSFNYYER